jgi:hypothetical protein
MDGAGSCQAEKEAVRYCAAIFISQRKAALIVDGVSDWRNACV